MFPPVSSLKLIMSLVVLQCFLVFPTVSFCPFALFELVSVYSDFRLCFSLFCSVSLVLPSRFQDVFTYYFNDFYSSRVPGLFLSVSCCFWLFPVVYWSLCLKLSYSQITFCVSICFQVFLVATACDFSLQRVSFVLIAL